MARTSELRKGSRLLREMSKPQVTITLGRSGQVVKRAGSASDANRSEYITSYGNKRPTRDRLGTNSDNLMLYDGPDKTKRQRGERHRWSLSYHEAIGGKQFGSHIQLNEDDLRYKLMQKRSAVQTPCRKELTEMDLCQKPSSLAHPIPPKNVGGISPRKNVVPDSRHASLMPKPAASFKPLKPTVRLSSTGGVPQKTSYSGEEPVTVAGLLHSLGLGKYAILFQEEEVDRTALMQMGDNDLKELGIPMGPRKKILLAVEPHPKHRSTS